MVTVDKSVLVGFKCGWSKLSTPEHKCVGHMVSGLLMSLCIPVDRFHFPMNNTQSGFGYSFAAMMQDTHLVSDVVALPQMIFRDPNSIAV